MNRLSIPASTATYTQGRGGAPVAYIVVHYTGGTGTARENGLYFAGGNRNASAHVFLDGTDVVDSVPLDSTAWACGNFAFNQRSVSIEVVSAGEDFSAAEVADLREVVLDLMGRYGVPAENVIRHRDAYAFGVRDGVPGSWVDPGKACPAPYVDDERWFPLWAFITGTSDSYGGVTAAPDAGDADDGGDDGDFHGGLYRCTVDGLRIRSAPAVSAPAASATYDRGETVVLDDWYTVADGYVWGRYTDHGGTVRYVAVGKATGRPDAGDYLVKA